jgi:tartrate dehydrogenase/decarboxylase/D-malate dehydrogenase
LRAIEAKLKDGPRTPDMGGSASTRDIGRAIAECVAASPATVPAN